MKLDPNAALRCLRFRGSEIAEVLRVVRCGRIGSLTRIGMGKVGRPCLEQLRSGMGELIPASWCTST
jgi:hypothetical protein